MMRVVPFSDPRAFVDFAAPMLLREEAPNCFFLGSVPSLKEFTFLCAICEDDTPVAAAVMTPGKHLFMTSASPQAMEAVVDFLLAQRISIPGIQSRRGDAEIFSQLWTSRTGAAISESSGMGIYKLTRVIPPPALEGKLRPARKDEEDLIAHWTEGFANDIGGVREDARVIAAERIASGRIFVWSNPQPVCMAAWAGPTPNGVRINLVYTPPEFRKRGYASACVAALSQRMLDNGKQFCFLYTDLANPTSNKIYQSIGYEHVRDDTRIFFAS